MASSFHKAESVLKSLFETKLGSFSRSNLVTVLAETAIVEIRDLTRSEAGKLRFAPDHFVIHANHATWERILRDQSWQDKFKSAVEKEARNSRITFQTPLRIDPVEDNNLEISDFLVECNWQADSGRNTQAMKLPENSSGSPSDDSCREYFIVEGKEFCLQKSVINLGRRDTNDLIINDRRVSRCHAQVRTTEGAATIYDLGSTGGTFVNNTRIRSQILKPGDVISLAGFPLIYHRERDLAQIDQISVESPDTGDTE